MTPTISAVLGPTNTGKTHLAIERMLGHQTGMIGLPLRLLARELYDRVVSRKGKRATALITGEERIVPPQARYFVCTTESMPVNLPVEFLAVDEIQLCADRDRGHVFTDRLLRARGTCETMFLGAATMHRVIRELVPDARFVVRPRFSELNWTGFRKVTRLPSRSAVVAFTVADVYELADILRQQQGGCAVVLGALSPRTRNAQVAMYQAGEVDYIVATDAIGMGLNMDVSHVAFAALKKFNGINIHELEPAELAQIAGRAGRHTNNGTFGTTRDIKGIDAAAVYAIENHQFPDEKFVMWRNADLDFGDGRRLLKSLERAPSNPMLVRPRNTLDHAALVELLRDPDVSRIATNPEMVRLLWEVCQVPDFRKVMHDHHVQFLAHVFRRLSETDGRLQEAWVARSVSRLDRLDGGLDALMTRIAHIRTWTYISHRSDWVEDHVGLQDETRRIEDHLSDALHEHLIHRFVDRRLSSVVRNLKGGEFDTRIAQGGEILVENAHTATIKGLQFVPVIRSRQGVDKALLGAARRAAVSELASRARTLVSDPDTCFKLVDSMRIAWRDNPVAQLSVSNDILRPRLRTLHAELMDHASIERVRSRLEKWMDQHIDTVLKPVVRLQSAKFSGVAAGIVFRLIEGLGVTNDDKCLRDMRGMNRDERNVLARFGVRFGVLGTYLQSHPDRQSQRLRAVLWALQAGLPETPAFDPTRKVVFAADMKLPESFYRSIGYRKIGTQAVRADAAEKLYATLRKATANGRAVISDDVVTMLGTDRTVFQSIAAGLGYQTKERDGELSLVRNNRRGKKRGSRRDPHSPFARLLDLDLAS